MIDINFYMAIQELKRELLGGEKRKEKYVFDFFEENRSKHPVLYNIETTNVCNMRCVFCPRTTRMTRKQEYMDMEVFECVIDQLKPFSEADIKKWDDFVEKEYGVLKNDIGENHFFLYVIAKVLTLHGWGEPLLDKYLAQRIALLTERGFATYFSCNPENINVDNVVEIFESGLDYFKLSIESVNDERQHNIRGGRSSYEDNLDKINQLLSHKKKSGYNTTIIVTMMNINTEDQENEFRQLVESLKGKDVYIYLKSRDNQWNLGTRNQTKAIHWLEFCHDPWSSMGLQVNGLVSACGREDYNNELIMGDSREESLLDIWNGEKYKEFRRKHFEMPNNFKCYNNCDSHLIGNYVSGSS